MCTDIRLETDRLILRSYVKLDRSAFITLNCDAQARKHMDGPLSSQSASHLFDRICDSDPTNNLLCLAVIERASHQYIGHTFLSRKHDKVDYELGFLLRQEYWGLGYGTEVAKQMVGHCFAHLGINRLVATVDVDNIPSIRVLQKAGFQWDKTIVDAQGEYYLFAATRTCFGTTQD